MNWLCQIIINENTGQILINISIALITIFIPVAISLFETSKKEDDFSSLDRAVILDYLVEGKMILWELSLLFLPILFWSVDDLFARFLIIILWVFGLHLAVKKLKNVYGWIRGNRFHYRFSYLDSLVIGLESEDLWRSVWNAKDINSQNENRFFEIFKNKVNDAFLRDDIIQIRITLKLIQDFEILVNKRDIIFLTSKGNVFPELLKWHYLSWNREYSNLGNNDDIDKFIVYSSISSTLDQIFNNILDRSINGNFSYGFFILIEEHLILHKSDKVTKNSNDYFYIESFLSVFYSNFFDVIEKSNQSHDIWEHYFPKVLKITEENLKQPFAKYTLSNYINWAIEKIRDYDNEEYDRDLDGVTENIFPSVEPIFWGIMMTLLMRSWGESRIKSLIEKPRNLGLVGRMFSWSGSIGDEIDRDNIFEKVRDEQLQDSIKLLCKIFPTEFSLNKIKEYIIELESLEYPDDERRELYRKQILEYMKLIEVYLTKK